MTRNEIEILLVEDDPEDIELTLHELSAERLTNRIEVVRDGEEALDFLFRRGPYADRDPEDRPRLILLDLKLPKVDGLQVLRELKANEATRTIPVVILTSSQEEKDLITGYNLGVNSYIQKPVDFDQFQKTIRQTGFYWLLVNQPAPAKHL